MRSNQTRRKFIATAISGAAASIAASAVFASGKPATTDEQVSAGKTADTASDRVASSEFIIFPWGGMPDDHGWGKIPDNGDKGQWGEFTDMNEVMRDLYDCGFNTSGFTQVRNLKHARNNHLMGILEPHIYLRPEATQEEADDIIKKMMDSIADPEDRKAVYAMRVWDEPHPAFFPQLNIWSEAVKKQGVTPYINMLPIHYGDEYYMNDYLDQFVKTCNPPFISYDNYTLLSQPSGELFYVNLEMIRNKSLQYEIPFWNVILGNAHFNYTEPSEGSLALQVYATLAYGGRGIGYFTFYTPHVGNYRLAAIDRFGYRTKTWEMIRSINLQIHALAPVYCKLKSINVFHTDHIPRISQGVQSAKLVESISDASLLVGEFTDADGKPYIMVVNKNMQSSVNFDVQFKEKGRIMLISQFGQGLWSFDGEQKWLAPGCGALLTVD